MLQVSNFDNAPIAASVQKSTPSPSLPSNKEFQDFLEIVLRRGAADVRRERLGEMCGGVRPGVPGRGGVLGALRAGFGRLRPGSGASAGRGPAAPDRAPDGPAGSDAPPGAFDVSHRSVRVGPDRPSGSFGSDSNRPSASHRAARPRSPSPGRA